MAYSEDPKAITKEFLKFCFDILENILEKAKAKVCMPPNNDSEDCAQLSKAKTDLTALKNEFIKDPSATLDEATAQLLAYETTIKQLLAERIDPNGDEADEASDKELRRSIQERMSQQNTIIGGGSSQ